MSDSELAFDFNKGKARDSQKQSQSLLNFWKFWGFWVNRSKVI